MNFRRHCRKVYGIVACQVSFTALAATLAVGPLQHPMVAVAVCLGRWKVVELAMGTEVYWETQSN